VSYCTAPVFSELLTSPHVHALFQTSLETTWRPLPCTQTIARQANALHQLIFTQQAHCRLHPPNSELPEHTPKAMQHSTHVAAHPAPTAPPQSTETPSDLTRHQAAHAMDTKAAPRALRLPELAEKAMDAKAAHRALQIPEVLEHILVHPPIKDLFVHQRVSTNMHRKITSHSEEDVSGARHQGTAGVLETSPESEKARTRQKSLEFLPWHRRRTWDYNTRDPQPRP
jgi:hypothetical protein